jgi:hypothetical protein
LRERYSATRIVKHQAKETQRKKRIKERKAGNLGARARKKRKRIITYFELDSTLKEKRLSISDLADGPSDEK